MNNVTHEQSTHPVPLTPQNAGDEELNGQEEHFPELENTNLSEVLSRLDEVRYSPRAETIRAIMRYAHEKDGALH